MVDRDRRVAVINRRVGELLGLPPDLMHEDTSFDAILRWQVEHGEFAAKCDVSVAMDSLMERGGLDASVPMYERTRPDGSVIEVRTTLLAHGGAVRTYTDVTERKRIVRDLAAARDLAEAAGRARSDFLAVMSHEIRTPLNGIIGATGLLMDGELDAEDAHFVEIIRQSGEHLLQLINNILDFSRLDASCIELEAVAFDLRTTIASAVDMVATAARAKGIRLDVTISDGVPRRVIGDPGRLRQVLLNLLGNGVKFTEQGGVHLAGIACRKRGGDRPVGGVGQRYRYRDSGRRAATPVPRVQPGGWIDLAPVRRQRAWACDQPPPGRANGRLDDGGKRTRRRQYVRVQHPAA